MPSPAPAYWVGAVLGASPTDSRSAAGALASLVPNEPTIPTLVVAAGCVTPGDGGGGTFCWVPTDGDRDDGGTIIVPKTGYYSIGRHWQRIYSGPLDIRWYGATANASDEKPHSRYDQFSFDRAAANWRAITNAIERAVRVGGGEVLIPAGIFEVDRPIRLYSKVGLRGVGFASQLAAAANFNNTIQADFERAIAVAEHMPLAPQMPRHTSDKTQQTEVIVGHTHVYRQRSLISVEQHPDATTVPSECRYGSVENLSLVSAPGSGVAAIAPYPPSTLIPGTSPPFLSILFSCFRNLFVDCDIGLLFDTYLQSCVIEDVVCVGAMDRLLELRGNANRVRNLRKEDGGTGQSLLPYITIRDFAGQPKAPSGISNGNRLEDIVIEGVTSPMKHGLHIENCASTEIHNYWFEGTANDGYAAIVVASIKTSFKGLLRLGVTGTPAVLNKLGLVQAGDVYIERLENDDTKEAWTDALNIGDNDPDTRVFIGEATSYAAADAYPLAWMNRVVVGHHVSRRNAGFPGYTGIVQQRFAPGQNLLVNPSFEAGDYGWNFEWGPEAPQAGPPPVELRPAEVGAGLMVRCVIPSGSSVLVWQWMAVSAGVPITVSMLVRGETPEGRGAVAPYLKGLGIASVDTANVADLTPNVGTGALPLPDTSYGWRILSATVIPTASERVKIGVKLGPVAGVVHPAGLTATTYYLDEAGASYGVETSLNPTRFGSIELGNRTFVSDAHVPSSGTWKPGDIVWNSAPAPDGPIGWVCTAAGRPGSWHAFAIVART